MGADAACLPSNDAGSVCMYATAFVIFLIILKSPFMLTVMNHQFI